MTTSAHPAKRARRSATPDLDPPSVEVRGSSPDPNAGLIDQRDLPVDRHVGRDGSSTPEIEAIPAGRQRQSIYLQAFEEMLHVVLEHERYLFSDVELEALDSWQQMSYEARYLFVRLFLRKNGWFRINSLSYEYDIGDMRAACEELCSTIAAASAPPSARMSRSASDEALPTSRPKTPEIYDIDNEELIPAFDPLSGQAPGMLGVSTEASQFGVAKDEGDLRNFAWSEAQLNHDNAIDEIVTMLSLDELKVVAKELKLNKAGTTRDSIIRSLKSSSANQTTLSSAFFGPKREPSPMAPLRQLGLNYDEQGRHMRQGTLLITSLLRRTGPCIRLCPAMLSLFARLHLIFHRSISLNEKSMTASVLARFKKRTYPSYKVARTFRIFESRDRLLEYEEALRVERRMEECMGEAPDSSSGWITDRAKREAGLREAKKVFDRVWPVWQRLVSEAQVADAERESRPAEGSEADRLAYYRKRFHPGWPLTRVVYKGAQVLAKLHEHSREAEVLKALLDQACFRRGKRGAWYERLALVVMHHLDGDKNLKRRQARKLCMAGLADPWTHLIYYQALQRRIVRLESALQTKPKQRHDFAGTGLRNATKRVLEGEKLSDGATGRKSSWRAHDGAEVSVEAFSLEYYERHQGWRGFHSENGILTTIFTLLFWDILFHPIDGVFEHAYQSAPLDLATDAFSIVRAALVAERLDALEVGQGPALLKETDEREREQKTWAVGVRWDYAAEDLAAIVEYLGGKALAAICRVYAEEWGHRVGGVPDLCLWHPGKRQCMFVEVKGPGDRLSETQRVWIDVLLGAGVAVELCSVKIAGEDFTWSDDDKSSETEDVKPTIKKKRKS